MDSAKPVYGVGRPRPQEAGMMRWLTVDEVLSYLMIFTVHSCYNLMS